MWSFILGRKKISNVNDVRERDKELRQLIAKHKANGNLKGQEAALKQLHYLRIANIQVFGSKGLDRYPSFLLEHGQQTLSAKVEFKANAAIKDFFKSIRFKRCSQLRKFDLLKFSADTKSPPECHQKDNQIFPNGRAVQKEWVNCGHSPRCYCNLNGINEASARRRKLIP